MSDEPKVMWSIGQIAERDGISKQAVSKIVKKLVSDHGIPVDRDGRGRISAVSLAHYDHHRDRFTNPAKQQPAGQEKTKPAAPADSFEEARRQREWLALERAKIEHQVEIGQLVRMDGLVSALETTGREIQSLVAKVEHRADDLAIAVSKEGSHGLRLALRKALFETNNRIAERLSEIAGEAPKGDQPIEASDTA